MILGLTGQSGAGKTTVAQIFRNRGFYVIDTDAVSRQIIPEVLPELVSAFGGDILAADGTLDRKALAHKAFADDVQTKKLNGIMHGAVMRSVWRTVDEKRAQGVENFIVDGAALYEAGADKGCDAVVAVLADKRLRKKRVMARDGITAQEAEQRFARQKSRAYLRRKADFIIENKNLSALDGKVCDILKQLKGRK